MRVERTTGSRAAAFAALGDPARLEVVEHLMLGDATPSELAAELAIGSNLMAHHLNVLESAGLIRRVRSEGDRRRAYVQAVRSALPTIDAAPLKVPARVLFVCTANTARSHLAVALWRERSRVPAASAGTHPAAAVDPGAVAVARRRGVPLDPDARPQPIELVLAEGDLVVTVCDRARQDLGAVAAIHWSVPDPVPEGSSRAFDAVVTQLDDRVAGLADRLAAVS